MFSGKDAVVTRDGVDGVTTMNTVMLGTGSFEFSLFQETEPCLRHSIEFRQIFPATQQVVQLLLGLLSQPGKATGTALGGFVV